MSKAILGGTLTTEAGDKGARSLGEVHNEVRKEIRNADVRQLARSVGRDLLFPLLALNSRSPVDLRRLPGISFDTSEAEDITAFSEAIPKLAAGMAVPVSWIQEKLNIPQPQGDEPVFTPNAGTAEPQPAPTPAALSADLPGNKDELDVMGERVTAKVFTAAIEPVLRPLVAAIVKEGPQAALDNAAELYPAMDDATLTEMLTRAIFVADLWGRLDAADR